MIQLIDRPVAARLTYAIRTDFTMCGDYCAIGEGTTFELGVGADT